MAHYQELIAWRKAMELAEAVYAGTQTFPREELYGLTTQLRRAAVSVPSNIAEGQGRRSRGEFIQFLGNSRGSLFEVETQLILSSRLKFLPQQMTEHLLQQTQEVSRILNGLILSLQENTT